MARDDETGMHQELEGDDAQTFVRITNRQIYDALTRQENELAKLTNRVDNAFGENGVMAKILAENIDLRKRVRGLELRFYGIAAGLMAAIVVLLRLGSVPGVGMILARWL